LLRFVPALVYAVAVVLFVKDRYSLFDFPLDDAWIHRVYSQAVAFGRGMAYNAGVQEAGSTSPLWSVVSAPVHWLEGLGTHVAAAVKAIGVLLGLISVYAVRGIAVRVTGSMLAGLLAASLFALEPRLHFAAFSGMENTLLLALWLGGLTAILSGRPVLFAALSGLMAVTRPEAALVLPFAVVCLFLDHDVRSRPRAWLAGLVLMALPLGLWCAFCRSVTGHWLPNTYYRKATPFGLDSERLQSGWAVLTEQGIASLPVFIPALVVGIALLLARRPGFFFLSRRPRFPAEPLLMLYLSPLVYLLAVVGTRSLVPDAYYWTRWVDPAALVLTVTACLGLAMVAALSCRLIRYPHENPIPGGRWIGVCLGLVFLSGILLSSPRFGTSFQERRARLASDSYAIHFVNVEPGRWINDNTPREAIIGVNDAGALRYFGKRWTIDFMGLNNSEIAFGRMDHRQALDAVDWLVIFPSWFQGMGLLGAIQEGFEPRLVMGVTEEKYTVCDCPGQTRQLILKRKEPG
jgi:hypothetical protein